MKEYKKFIKSLGFVALKPNLYLYDNNGIYYIVSLDRNSSRWRVGFEVSHRGLFDKNNPMARTSPVGGWLSLFGVGSSTIVRDPDEYELKYITVNFFSNFADASDFSAALKVANGSGIISDINNYLVSDGVGGVPSWSVPFAGGILQYSEISKKLKSLLESEDICLMPPRVEDNFLFVRKRVGGAYDCVRFIFDDFGTFFKIKLFMWDNRWDGHEWSGFNDFADCFMPRKMPTRSMEFFCDELFRKNMMRDVIDYFDEFGDINDYVDYVGVSGNYFGKMAYPELKKLII